MGELACGNRQLPTGILLVLLPTEILELWALNGTDGDYYDARKQRIAEALGVGKDAACKFQDEITSSFFVDLLCYAQAISLTAQKAALFASIMWEVFALLHRSSETTRRIGERYSVSECFQAYEQLLAAHTAAADTMHISPSLGVFSIAEAQRLTDFVSGTFFQHSLLYQSILAGLHASAAKHVEVVVQQPLPPPDLRRGKPRKHTSGVIGALPEVVSGGVVSTGPEVDSTAVFSRSNASDQGPSPIDAQQTTAPIV